MIFIIIPLPLSLPHLSLSIYISLHRSITQTVTFAYSSSLALVLSYGCLSCSNYMMCSNCQSLKRTLQTYFKGREARPRTQLTRSTEPRWAGGPRAPLPIVLVFTLISECAMGRWEGEGKGRTPACKQREDVAVESDVVEPTVAGKGHWC